ncbi:L-lactate/malate dehydrogenase [Aspergillus japonicus CBS 114.51]|uniref:L-lactate/malate dehydrogenase n=1 Tax=Aspergillus japonicus CBS 114.51 TaxID=1448312 RepID=A0A8T8WKR2_ASPJA|nr:L-lactate/malate dehydrogenase [Aspergillus japonicus CBS 114.51]RAH76262.1 L-lactate/malate dehydrogenase [Aspergillus japonicus CBS 114.51]
MTSRIGIIGVGPVGAAAAYALLLQHVARELWLVDVKLDRRDGQVRDLADVAAVVADPESPGGGAGATVRAATHHEVAAECDVIVITAGSKYTIGETSMQHLYRKVSIVRSIVAAMQPIRRDAVLLVVSNPVDLLTSLVKKMAGLPAGQVLGTGTELDGVRLRALVAAEMRTSASSINLNVVGVHGPSQLATWSTATINGKSLHPTLLSTHHPTLLADECKRRSEAIVHSKGSTEYGIAAVIARLCAAILDDKQSVHAVSHLQAEFGCCFSLPAVLGREGVVRTGAVELNEGERAEMERSVRLLRGRIGSVEGDGVV